MLANRCYIAKLIEPDKFGLRELVVVQLEDSKTTEGRTVAMSGVTRGMLALPCADYMRHLWASSEIEVRKGEVRDGMEIERPDYWVVRVSLLGMRPADWDELRMKLLSCHVKSINEMVKYTVRTAETRRTRENDGEEKKYINIAGGAKESEEVMQAYKWVVRQGFGRFVDVVPGPLLRATDGKKLTHMPLQPGSTYAHLSKSIEQA